VNQCYFEDLGNSSLKARINNINTKPMINLIIVSFPEYVPEIRLIMGITKIENRIKPIAIVPKFHFLFAIILLWD